jgi:membrane protein
VSVRQRRRPRLSRSDARAVVGGLIDAFQEKRLLTHASEIAFQVVTTLVPLVLLAIALAGALGFADVWRSDLAPRVQANLSPAAFSVVDTTVEQVLSARRVLWITLGAVLTAWEVSGAVRATMGTLNHIYEAKEDRPWVRRYVVSLVLSVAVLVCILGAVFSVAILGRIVSVGGASGILFLVGRWAAAVALLALAVALLLKWGPAAPRPLRWVSAGTALVIVSWIVSSLAFGFYATRVANYTSLFGNLAFVFILLNYVNISSVAFVLGVELDELLEEEVSGGRPAGTRGS